MLNVPSRAIHALILSVFVLVGIVVRLTDKQPEPLTRVQMGLMDLRTKGTPTPKPPRKPVSAVLRAPTRLPRNDPPDVALVPVKAGGDVLATGDASWYGDPPCGSRGAAMLSYIWGHPYFQVVVTHAGRSITATVCDNGPHISERVIDLSPTLFQELCPSCDGVISGVTVRRG